jgi:polyvinyl alcohol dehydrogenase (cytochrome)
VNGSLAVAGGRVFVPVARVGRPFVVALDATTGAVLWQTTVDTQVDADLYASPVVAGGVVYQGWSALFGELHDAKVDVRGGLAALDATTGALRWHAFTVPAGFNGGGVWSTPAVDLAGGVLYAGTGNAYHAPAAATTDSILKVRLSDGALVAHFQATPNDVFNGTTSPVGPDYDFGASPNLVVGPDRTPIVGEGQKSGAYWAVRRSDMRPLWHQQLGPGSAVGGILGSTAYDGSRIYGPITAPGYVWALEAPTGALAWVSPVGDPVHWSPVSVSNGVAYSADSAGFLDAWDAATGLPMARVALGLSSPGSSASTLVDPAFGGVALAGGSVFADTGTQGATGAVVALRPAVTG